MKIKNKYIRYYIQALILSKRNLPIKYFLKNEKDHE